MKPVRIPYLVITLGVAACIFAMTSQAFARGGPTCSGTMRSRIIGDSGPPLWTPIWEAVSHACCCTCPPIPNTTGVCMEVPVGPVQGGQNTLVCACVYTNAQGQVVAVGLDYNPVTGEPDCDSQAKRLVANPPPSGALQSQSCAGFCNVGDCEPTIEETWTNNDPDGPHYYKDEYCECK